MSYAGMEFQNRNILMEREYSLLNERHVASLLTTGNGYMGVRGSLEEYNSLGVQGMLVRGVMDEVVEVRLTVCDNMYMKKYYVNEERQKEFEKEERAIDLFDFLLIRFEIGGETFYPWEGKVLSWKRWLDISDGTMSREVEWENEQGQITKFTFSRFASFADDHIYCMRASAEPVNYSGEIRIMSGLDLRTKSNGQLPQTSIGVGFDGQSLWQEEIVGPKYGFHAVAAIFHALSKDGTPISPESEDSREGGLVTQCWAVEATQGQKIAFEKQICVITSRDIESREETAARTARGAGNECYLKPLADEYLAKFAASSYEAQYEAHKAEYQRLFAKLEIQIEGDPTADHAIQFSNYHTLISLERNDYVHSFSAKGLTGEMYNNFVWWDAEIFQAPVFQKTMPEYAKNDLLFRWSHLKEAKELAVKEGCRGARFPFTTGVTGEETVWVDVRHPFMQIHCVSDIGLSVLNYYASTGDDEFMKTYGMELLTEISRYWISRVTRNEEKNRYEILQVTGTDEHHPYVDNNAYTNYSVYRVLSDTVRFLDKYGMEDPDRAAFEKVAAEIYLPLEDTGLIPQFDGYFDLSRELEIQGGSKSGYTQMKSAGLYNKSQVIKQPDVLMLFAYQGLTISDEVYRRNVDYYQGRCEAASSLSYCVHSICYADLGMPESTYGYLMETAEMDLKNLHGGSEDGVHSGCAAGAWTAVVRGVAGMRINEDRVVFDPHFIPWWKQVRFSGIWHGQAYTVTVSNEGIEIAADEANPGTLCISVREEYAALHAGETYTQKFAKAVSIR